MRQSKSLPVIFLSCVLSLQLATAESTPSSAVNIPLVVSAGAPLRVYITRRLPMRKGENVEAKLVEPVYAFDRVVIPAGVTVRGHVTTLDGISKTARAQ